MIKSLLFELKGEVNRLNEEVKEIKEKLNGSEVCEKAEGIYAV